jgi:hypothetical protein
MPRGKKAKHEVTEETHREAQAMAACGVDTDDMALIFGIGRKRLEKIYGKDISTGRAKAHATIGKRIFAIATRTEVDSQTLKALILYARSQMGWRDFTIVQQQQLDKHGKPMNPPEAPKTDARVEAEKLTPDQITEAHIRMLNGDPPTVQ